MHAHAHARAHTPPTHKTLHQIAPNPDEVKALRMYRGPAEDLSPPERFLLAMADVPRLVPKISALIFRLQFRGLCTVALAGMKTLRAACAEVRGSSRLRAVLAAALAAGNRLNAGSHRGGAEGLRLESLLKMSDVKAALAPPGDRGGPGAEDSSASANGAAPCSTAGEGQQQQQQQQQPGAVAVTAPPPGIRTLLEFVAWVVQAQEAAAEQQQQQQAGSRPGASLPTGGQHAAGVPLLPRGPGYLAEQLPSLGEAVQRMQSDVSESMKALDMGMRTLQGVLEAEQSEAAAGSHGGGAASAPAQRQAAFRSELEAAAAARTTRGSDSENERPDEVAAASNGSLPPQQQQPAARFAAMLSEFVASAQEQQAALAAAAAETDAAVRGVLTFLGEGGEPEAAPVFEGLQRFVLEFDHSYLKVARLEAARAAAAAAAAKAKAAAAKQQPPTGK